MRDLESEMLESAQGEMCLVTFRKGIESEQERRAREESWELERREAEETQWFGAALERLEEAWQVLPEKTASSFCTK